MCAVICAYQKSCLPNVQSAQEHGTEIGQIHTVAIPCGDVLFAGPCRIPAVVSFLEVSLVLPGISPPLFCPPFIPATIFKMAGIQSKHSLSAQSF